jgi:hypothetical protein
MSRPRLNLFKNQLLNNATLVYITKAQQNPSPDAQKDERLGELGRLQRDVKCLKLEQGILKKVNELPKQNWALIGNS